MSNRETLSRALSLLLPEELHHFLELLTSILIDLASNQATQHTNLSSVLADLQLQAALKSLAGKSLSYENNLIAFGVGSNVGDVTIQEAAGGNIIKFIVEAHFHSSIPSRSINERLPVDQTADHVQEINVSSEDGTYRIQKAIEDYCNSVVTKLSHFVPFGGIDRVISLEQIYQELAIYRQFRSPYYKSREDLIRDLNIEEHSDLVERLMARTDEILEASISSFERAFLHHQERGFSLAYARSRSVEGVLKQNNLIDELKQLTGPRDLNNLLCDGLVKLIFRNFLTELGYQEGVLSRLLLDHAYRLDNSAIMGIQNKYPLERELIDKETGEKKRDTQGKVVTEKYFVSDIFEYIQKCNYEARYEIESKVLFLTFGELRRKQKTSIDNTFITGFVADIREVIYQEIQIYEAKKERVTFENALLQWGRCVILGHPGSGKSTLLKHKALLAAKHFKKNGVLPILIELRRLNSEATDIWELIAENFALSLPKNNIKPLLDSLLNEGKVLLLFDGLDEVDQSRKSYIVDQILLFLSHYPNSPCAITCRILGYLDLLPYKPLELAELDGGQIREFIKGWFKDQRDYGLRVFMDTQQSSRLWRMVRNPFLLTMYCIARENRTTSYFNRSSLYTIATNVLLETLDQKRGLSRNRHPLQIKKTFLIDLAANLHGKARELFSLDDLSSLLNLSDRISEDKAPLILDEIVNNSGIIRRLSEIAFGFAHLSIQEFYTAVSYAQSKKTLTQFINNPRYWETIRLYFGLAKEPDAERILNQMSQMATNERWQFTAFLASCIIEMPIIPEQHLLQTAYHLIKSYRSKDIGAEAKTTLMERFIDLIQRDQNHSLDHLLKSLISLGYQDLTLAVTALLAAENENKQDLLREALISLDYDYAKQVASIVAKQSNPNSINLLQSALQGRAAIQSMELLGAVARTVNHDITELIYSILIASPPTSMTRPADGFYLRLSSSIKPGRYPEIEAYIDYYISNISSYTLREKIFDTFDKTWKEPDSEYMEKIESVMGIPDESRDSFRSKIMSQIGSAVIEKRPFSIADTDLYPCITELLKRNEAIYYNLNTYNIDLWRPKSESDGKNAIGLDVAGVVYFPGIKQDVVLNIVCDICEKNFTISYLNLPFREIKAEARRRILFSLEKALRKLTFACLRKNISLVSYLTRAVQEIMLLQDTRVIGLAGLEADRSELSLHLYKYKRGRAINWWKSVSRYEKLVSAIQKYNDPIEPLIEIMKQDQELITRFLDLKELKTARELKKHINIIVQDKQMKILPTDSIWSDIIPLAENDVDPFDIVDLSLFEFP